MSILGSERPDFGSEMSYSRSVRCNFGSDSFSLGSQRPYLKSKRPNPGSSFVRPDFFLGFCFSVFRFSVFRLMSPPPDTSVMPIRGVKIESTLVFLPVLYTIWVN